MTADGSVVAVVLTRNRRDSLRWCLEGIREQNRPVQEIVVVDNDSHDGTGEMLRAEFPEAIHVRLAENVGASGGFAECLRVGAERGHDWIWCFADDCRPISGDGLRMLLAYASARENVGLIRVIMKDPRTGKTRGGGPFAGSLHPAAAIKACGVPREDLFFEFEDTEYWFRLEDHGYRVLTCNNVFVWHRWQMPSQTLGGLFRGGVGSPWRSYYRFRNRVYYYSRRRLWKDFARTLYWMGKWLVVSAIFGPQRVMQVRMIIRGLVDGLRGDLGRRVEPPSVPS